MSTLRVFSLNIEKSRHLKRFPQAIRERMPDVVLLQEVVDQDIQAIMEALDMQPIAYAPMGRAFRHDRHRTAQFGVALYIRPETVRIHEVAHRWYACDADTPHMEWPQQRYVLQQVRIEKDGREYVLCNTHFPWSLEGEFTKLQEGAMATLLRHLGSKTSFALFGDLNAPRTIHPLWQKLAARYQDWIPQHYASTLDPTYHRAPHIQFVVDACFTTEDIVVPRIEIVHGVSDHCAIVADLEYLNRIY